LLGCDEDTGAPTSTLSQGLVECEATNLFDRADFSDPTRIDNRFFSLTPGKQYILDGTANRGGGVLPHRVVFTVTDLTKVIDGVNCRVLYDRDYNDGALHESELAFFAQDDFGNVWNLGEYPEEYVDGVFIGAPSTWIAGVGGAEAGYHVPGTPKLDARFLQGFVQDINFLDCGRVYQMGQSTCVPYNCYENVLVVAERSPLEPGTGHQLKYYAPGVGIARVGALEDPEAETLVLVNLLQLNPKELAEARTEALKLEERAYQVSEWYRHTEPCK
jgi:hypothetical protein